jgi:hypothetical protein
MRSMSGFLGSLILVGAASASVAVVACGSDYDSQPPVAAAGARPGCPGPTVVVRGPERDSVASMNVAAGQYATVTVDVTDVGGAHFISGTLIVARPGSQADAGDPSALPPDAAALPLNQLESSTTSSAGAKTRSVTVSWVPSSKGAYPWCSSVRT